MNYKKLIPLMTIFLLIGTSYASNKPMWMEVSYSEPIMVYCYDSTTVTFSDAGLDVVIEDGEMYLIKETGVRLSVPFNENNCSISPNGKVVALPAITIENGVAE